MIKSNLTNYVVPASSTNYSNGRQGNKVSKITVHHMAGVLTSKQCGYIFQTSGRNGSSNYGIGNDGDIAIYVSEDDRSWASSSRANDNLAITIEVSNSSRDGNWPVSNKAFNSLVNLCVDICKRYNFKLTYTGDSTGTLTRHNMFAATACPGSYLQSKFQELARTVNSRLNNTTPITPPTPSINNYLVGDIVNINGIYTASNSINKLNPAKKSGTITKIITGALNPYLLDNGNLGWTNESCITNKISSAMPTPPANNSKSITNIANEVIAGKWGNGSDRINNLTTAGYDASAVQLEVNKILSDNSSTSSSSSVSIKINDKVKVKNGAKDYTGKGLASFVYTTVYTVIQINGDRAVIGNNNIVTAAININNLYTV